MGRGYMRISMPFQVARSYLFNVSRFFNCRTVYGLQLYIHVWFHPQLNAPKRHETSFYGCSVVRMTDYIVMCRSFVRCDPSLSCDDNDMSVWSLTSPNHFQNRKFKCELLYTSASNSIRIADSLLLRVFCLLFLCVLMELWRYIILRA